ncbi:MAG: UDP-3-O-(3-hydroxymyristoyl)glucosamine N-acyltransferase [Salibacteraceae bacterium]
MLLSRPYSLQEVADLVEGAFAGDLSISAKGINEIHVVQKGDIVFVDHPKYYDKTLQSDASIVLINKRLECPKGKGLIFVDSPFDCFNQLTSMFLKEREEGLSKKPEIHPTVTIMAGAHIGNFVQIGEGTVIHPGVVIYDHTIIGKNVTIQANAVIGSEAFYYNRSKSQPVKMTSVGHVEIGDDVEIGAGCTIDRGVSSATIIGQGTKLDNQIHIGHDTKVGRNCLFAAQVGISGCVTIEDNVVLWGQVGCAANLTIGEGAVVYAQSGIIKSLEARGTYFGSPANEAKIKMRELATLTQLSRRNK